MRTPRGYAYLRLKTIGLKKVPRTLINHHPTPVLSPVGTMHGKSRLTAVDVMKLHHWGRKWKSQDCILENIQELLER
jgi:hypothetical protein